MVAHLISLRFRLLGNALKRSPWQLIAAILGGLYGLGVLVAAVAGLVALGFAPVELAATVTVLAGAAVVLGWIVVPLVAAGIDQTVDPVRLAPYPIPLTTLVVGLTISGVLGVAGMATSLAALATTATWVRSPLAALLAIVGAVLGVLTCVIGSRAVVALLSGHSGRRSREARFLIAFVPLILLGPIITFTADLVRAGGDIWPTIARIVSWTPLGAAWALPGDAATGAWTALAGHLLIAVATPLLLAALWRWALARALERPPREESGGTGTRGLGALGLLPDTVVGAVAARCLVYWRRDPRYAQSLIVLPILPVLLGFYATLTDASGLLIALGPAAGLLLGLAISTDVSYDNTAFALHLQKGVRGIDDRLGRVLAAALFSVPVTVVFTLGSVAFLGDWAALPGLLGVSLGLLATGFGLSSIASAWVTVPVPAPGDNPFKSRPGAGATLMVQVLVTWTLVVALCLPELVLAILAAVLGQPLLGWAALVVGLLLGAVLLVVGVRVGGRVLDRRGPELLVQLQRQR